MKRGIVVGILLAGLMVSSAVLLLGSHRAVAGGLSTPSQTTAAATEEASDAETADSNVQEPVYTGSIAVADANAKDKASESTSLQGLAKIVQADAEKAALAKVQGTVVTTTLDDENGYLVYSVTIRDAQGKTSDVKVDAGTGSILTVEASDGAEAKGEESSRGPDTDTVQKEVQSEN